MCGIAGAIIPHLHEPALLHALGRRMGEAIAHRGPDDAGTWVDAEAGLVLSHRRLSIVDLSPEGHQPMLSEDGGHSDTEVLLAAIAEWGVQTALQRSNGMLALAAWDRRERVLWLARDRIGKKPLYYGLAGDGSILFGSELAALRACPALQPKVDPDALALLLRLDYIPAPYSILHGVHKLPAGTLLRLDTSDTAALTEALDALPQPWWNARERQQAAIDQRFAGSEEMALDVLDALLREAVSMRMEADVPLGAFLSGGTDSSLVTALMQTQSTRPLRSFSIGFDHAGHDESTQARAVAAQLGTEHIEFHADGRAALDLVPEMPQVFDEPFADSSQLPTLLLCKLARRHVTVALSGDGGDELFFGYRRYRRALDNHARLRRLPAGLLARLVGEPGERARLGGLAALRAELATGGLQGIAHRRIQRWRLPERVVLGARRQATAYDDPAAMLANGPAADQLMAMDFASYLPEDILTKVDRTSMAVALEARAPLLDWRVVEFAWSLPQAMKHAGGELKYLPKRLLCRYLPPELVYRRKSGFGAPIGHWLRGPLRDWAETLLDEHCLREQGHFDPAPIRTIWREFLAGQHKWHTHLWSVLMFQAWREHWQSNASRHT